jgi:hypothetical protein
MSGDAQFQRAGQQSACVQEVVIMAKRRFPTAQRLAHAFDDYLHEHLFSFEEGGVLGYSFDELVSGLPAALEQMPLCPWVCHELCLPDGSPYAAGFRAAARFHRVESAENAIFEILDVAKTDGLWHKAATEIAVVAAGHLFEVRFYVLSAGTRRAVYCNMGSGRPEDLTSCLFRSYLSDMGAEELGFGQDAESCNWAMIVQGANRKELLEALRKSCCIALT